MTRLSRRYGPRAPGWAIAGVLLALCALLLPVPVTGARADTPLDLDSSGRITDTVGALGRRRAQVEAALDRLHTAHHVQLYVTYVRNFSGRAGRTWADSTADRNGLGPRDVLLAIATFGHQYAVSADKDSGFRQDQLDRVAAVAIAPALEQHDWAGAAVGAADGYRAVLEGKPVKAPRIRPGDSNPGADGLVPGDRRVWVPIACSAGLALILLHLGARRAARRRAARRAVLSATTPPGLARMAQPLTPLPELDAEAARNLVGTDDAVHTSAEELFFATAQLGEPATRPFAEAVAYARGELAQAFRLRQQLDEAPHEDEDIRRHALDEICSRCTSANRRLDAESSAFDRLRGLKAHAKAILAHAESTARALEPRIGTAEAALAALAQCRSAAALAPVGEHPAKARDRLAFAGAALAEARTALAERDGNRAAISLRAAEAALSQARTLADAVLRHSHELTGATARLRDAVAEAEAALQTAPEDHAARALAEVLAEARRVTTSGRHDPRALLRRVDAAAAGLGHGPGGRPARAVLAARGEVSAARDFLATHRGAIGAPARTRLAEAERHLARAEADPEGAERASARADSLARQARALAEQDVDAYDTPFDDPCATHPARALGGALLGGIILAGLLPATFGGGETRGRLAG